MERPSHGRGRSYGSATRTLAIPFATTAPDPNPASVPGVERILKEALRCLKRRLSDAVYRCLVANHRDHACAT
jgi:hypothetical protein